MTAAGRRTPAALRRKVGGNRRGQTRFADTVKRKDGLPGFSEALSAPTKHLLLGLVLGRKGAQETLQFLFSYEVRFLVKGGCVFRRTTAV